MKTIRHNTFETNSSSSHSITLSETGNLVYKGKLTDEVFEIETGEFGWEFETYSGMLSKASYLATHSQGDHDQQQILIDAIKKHTGAAEVIIYDRGGYIDHQSFCVAEDVFEGGEESIINFIFNPQSILETGNDNC